MVKSLIDKKTVVGRTRNEVTSLLDEPQFKYRDANGAEVWRYPVGAVGPGVARPARLFYLDIEFGNDVATAATVGYEYP